MSDKTKRRALGRGLSSLIPVADDQTAEGPAIVSVNIEEIHPNPFQPRSDFNEEEIRNLAESIKNQGLLQPILVRAYENGFQIVSGERRLRALKHLGRTVAPCIIREKTSDREMLEMALVENIQRENLNEIEKAAGYNRLLVECGLSHEQLAERIGASRSAVTNTLRLLKLPEKLQEMVRRGDLSMGHARALLSISDQSRQQQLAERIVAEGLSVRDVENAVQNSGRGTRKARAVKKNQPYDPDTQQIIEKLQYKFGTAIVIRAGANKGGTIEIRYYGTEDMNRIVDILLK